MKCEKCRSQVGLLVLTCRECTGKYCTRCIQLELHQCRMLEGRSESERALLEKKLVKVEAPKVIKL